MAEVKALGKMKTEELAGVASRIDVLSLSQLK